MSEIPSVGHNSIVYCPCCSQAVPDVRFLADPITCMITNGAKTIRLNSKLFKLARHLFDAHPSMSTKENIYNQVFTDHAGNGPEIKIVEVMICRLRPLLAEVGLAIETMWARGYRIVEAEPGESNAIKEASIRIREKGSMHRWTPENEIQLIDLMRRKQSATVCATIMRLPYSTVTRAYKRLQSKMQVA